MGARSERAPRSAAGQSLFDREVEFQVSLHNQAGSGESMSNHHLYLRSLPIERPSLTSALRP